MRLCRLPSKTLSRRSLLVGATALIANGNQLLAQSAALYVPPEDAPHEATLMMWPNSPAVYDDAQFLRQAQRTIALIANTISQFEPVILLAAADHHATIRALVSDRVTLWDIATEDLWCRDAGPLFALRGSDRVVSHIQFNGWGGEQVHHNDSCVAQAVADRMGLPVVPSGLVGEAGGVEHDGHGVLLAHESSWVEPGRNPGLGRARIEQRLLTAYGAQRMIWSPGVLDQDITDYHIDSLARFTGPREVLITLPRNPDPADAFHQAALQTLRALETAGLRVTRLHEPVRRRVSSPDFVATYANYYVCNGAVIASQFGDADTDAAALRALKLAYPNRTVVALNTDPLGELGGGIHCATQQVPAA